MKKKEIIKGRWFEINKKIKTKVLARYHKIKDWVMDPKGYFLIDVDKKKKILRVGYCKLLKKNKKITHTMVTEIYGKTALEIVNTLIRKKYISSLQHAADMGIELNKAELSLRYNLNYVQDKDLILK